MNEICKTCGTEHSRGHCYGLTGLKPSNHPSDLLSWDGNGLPPIGCECEYSLNGNVWRECIIEMYVGTQGVVMSCDVFEGMQYVNFIYYPNTKFRPIRTEAERKRESIIHALDNILSQTLDQDASLPVEIYKAIAAGNIRGLKLEDS